LGAAVRLATVLSTVAALLAIGIDSVGEVSNLAMAATVAVVGFVTSWVQSGRPARTAPITAVAGHRRTTITRLHQRAA
jgi:hypothetical protein